MLKTHSLNTLSWRSMLGWLLTILAVLLLIPIVSRWLVSIGDPLLNIQHTIQESQRLWLFFRWSVVLVLITCWPKIVR